MGGINAMKFMSAMTFLGLFIVAVMATNSTQLRPNQTNPSDDAPTSYIVGGQGGTQPSTVSLQHFGKHCCVGTILNNQYVSVPASCLHDKQLKDFSVIFGRTKLEEEGGETRRVVDSRSNPDWDDSGRIWSNDEAVIKVDSPVTLRDSIKAVCLADKESVFPTGTDASVYGWGFIEQDVELPSPQELQYVNVTVTHHGQCNHIYQGRVTDGMVCAGNMAGGKDACTRDQGAPLMVRQGDNDWIEAGAVIRSPKVCGAAGKPTVYWRPGAEFITTAIQEMGDALPECGIRENLPDGLRIYKGQEAAPHSWPWTVYIQDADGYFMGGGVVLNRNFVATDFYARPGWFVVLGAHSLSSNFENTQKIMIEQVMEHPEYTQPQWPRYGMRLLRLSQPIEFNKNVKPVCLPPETGVFPPAGTKCMVTGWGRSSLPGPKPTDRLNEYSATIIITNDQCRQDLPGVDRDKYITDTTFCTAASETYPTWNDEGGPVMCENADSSWTLYGVFAKSWYSPYPSVHHNVTYVLSWVKQTIEDQASQVCFKRFLG